MNKLKNNTEITILNILREKEECTLSIENKETSYEKVIASSIIMSEFILMWMQQ